MRSPRATRRNGNVARMVSVFGRRTDVEGPDGYVFFAADSAVRRTGCARTSCTARCTSARSTRGLSGPGGGILHTGVEAFEAALDTINVGKFNLGFCSIGMAETCSTRRSPKPGEDPVRQARHRVRPGQTDPLGALRPAARNQAVRAARGRLCPKRQPQGRRYLLFTPINKMQVTTEGERIVRLLAEVISAKGFERDSYFESAKNIIDGLPKLKGTVHVNRALTLKFLPNYLFGSEGLDAPPARHNAGDDAFLFAQGPTRGLGKITFPDWRPVFDAFAATPNVAVFREQADALVRDDRGGAPHAGADDQRPRLPAVPVAAVHAHPIRPADPRPGAARRYAAGRHRPHLRDAGARLHGHGRRAPRQGVLDGGRAAVGARERFQAPSSMRLGGIASTPRSARSPAPT